jgi:hypothetical protein
MNMPRRSEPLLEGAGKALYAFGPRGTKIGIAIARNPAIAKQVADGLAAESDFQVNRAPDNPNVIVLFDRNAEAEDKDLAEKCVASG